MNCPMPRAIASPSRRCLAPFVVVAPEVVRIGFDGANLKRAQRDLVGRGGRAHRDDDGTPNASGETHGPLEHAHPAHRTADDGGPRSMPRWSARAASTATWSRTVMIGKSRSERTPSWIERRRSGRALGATQHVRTDDEELLSVDGEPRTDESVPPARREVTRSCITCGVGVARQRVQHEHGVRAISFERAPRFVSDVHASEATPAFEGETLGLAPRSVTKRRSPGLVACAPVPQGSCGHALYSAKPASRSARMSSIDSMPTERRTRSGLTPVVICSSSVSWEWVVEAG